MSLPEADGEPFVFANNRLTIAVERGNPHAITSLDDLSDDGLVVVLADPTVPAGAYAAELLERAGITIDPASLETNVRAVASKVALGEADAGIVYRTDIAAYPGQLDSVEIPSQLNVTAAYPIVVVRNSGAADALLAFVLGEAGRQALARCGIRAAVSTERRRGTETSVVLTVLGVCGALVFVLPLVALLIKVPWRSIGDIATSGPIRSALWLSLVTSIVAAVISLVFGVPLAWVLARSRLPGRNLLRAICTLSMVLPPVVGGVALFLAVGRRGLIGEPLERWFGITLPFTTPAVVLAQVFVAMPFLVLTVDAALEGLDHRVEDAARTLGGSEWYVFRHVTLPAIRPAVLTGVVLTWARALGEFGATITFAGSLPGVTRTMPLETYLALETDLDRAVLLSLVLVAVSFAVLYGLRGRWVGAALGRSRS